MRSILCAIVLAACAPATTIEVEAPSLPGARVRYDEASTVLDAQGRGAIAAPPLYEAFFELEVVRGGSVERLRSECVPPLRLTDDPIEVVRVLVRRELESGRCVLVALELEQNGSVVRGRYRPERFDDVPCGAFAP